MVSIEHFQTDTMCLAKVPGMFGRNNVILPAMNDQGMINRWIEFFSLIAGQVKCGSQQKKPFALEEAIFIIYATIPNRRVGFRQLAIYIAYRDKQTMHRLPVKK